MVIVATRPSLAVTMPRVASLFLREWDVGAEFRCDVI